MTSATETPVYPRHHSTRILRAARRRRALSGCFQCQKCSVRLPRRRARRTSSRTRSSAWRSSARDEELLSSRFIWECTSCGTCEARCPQGVDLPATIDALRRLSRRGRTRRRTGTCPSSTTSSSTIVRQSGRAHELALMAAFKLRTRRFTQDVGKLPMMLRKGKFALLPRLVPGRDERRRIFGRAPRAEEGEPMSYVFYPGCSLESTAKDYAPFDAGRGAERSASRCPSCRTGPAAARRRRTRPTRCSRSPCRRRTWPPPRATPSPSPARPATAA